MANVIMNRLRQDRVKFLFVSVIPIGENILAFGDV